VHERAPDNGSLRRSCRRRNAGSRRRPEDRTLAGGKVRGIPGALSARLEQYPDRFAPSLEAPADRARRWSSRPTWGPLGSLSCCAFALILAGVQQRHGGSQLRCHDGIGPIGHELDAADHDHDQRPRQVSPRARAPPSDRVPQQVAGSTGWVPIGRLVSGCSALYETHVGAVSIVWMDPRLLSCTLYSGSLIPGGGPYIHTAPVSESMH